MKEKASKKFTREFIDRQQAIVNSANAAIYRQEATDNYPAALDALDEALTTIERLKLAASGRGMVSEMADLGEATVLIVGLYDRIERAERKLLRYEKAK